MGSRPPTPFEQRVYDELVTIPAGRVISYGALARRLGVNSSQAIGQALKRNPNAPEVPCHRVLRKDGSLGGYQGSAELGGAEIQRKIELLELEGVSFDDQGRLVEGERLLTE